MISEVKFQIFESVNRYGFIVLIRDIGNGTGRPRVVLLRLSKGGRAISKGMNEGFRTLLVEVTNSGRLKNPKYL